MDTDELIDEPGLERFKRAAVRGAVRGAFAFLACALAALGIPCLFGQAPLWVVAAFFIALSLWCVGLRWAMLKLYARGLW